MTNGNTINKLLQNGISILKNAGIENEILDARALLCYILQKDNIYLNVHKDDIIDIELQNKYMDYIIRRSKKEPFAYITNSKEFMSLDFYVDKNVLIPRPDTEILVEKVINLCSDNDKEYRILDLCTGSGAIAVSLAHYIPNCVITAVDISEPALKIASKNAKKHNVQNKIVFREFDALGNISILEKFDIIVSNPPYISKCDVLTLESNVKDFEPILALDGGKDGLDFYRNIVRYAPDMLEYNGILAFEIGYDQANDVSKLLENNFKEISIINDYAGNDRVITAKKDAFK